MQLTLDFMKKLLTGFVALAFMASCEKHMDLPQTTDELLAKETLSKMALHLHDSIVPLDSTLFPKVSREQQKNQIASAFSHLYELNGLTFYLEPKNVYLGNNTLQSTSLGQEVVLGSRSPGNNAQLFYLQFLPASSGIPYLIRSYALGEPIGVGSYASAPNDYVVYTKQPSVTSLFGFSWDFYLNDAQDGFIIENQDIIGSGPGGPWDIFYHAIQANNGSLSLVRRNNASVLQQFNIIPNDEFIIQSVNLDLNNAQITATAPYALRDGTVSNGSSNNVTHNLTFTESEAEQSSFKETNGITTNKTGSVNLGISLFSVVDIGGSYSVQQGASQNLEYGANSTRTIQVQESYSIIVPPQTSVSYQFKAMRHQVNMAYSATIFGVTSSKTMNVTGVYSGVDYSSTFLEVTETPLTGRGSSRTYTIHLDDNVD